MKLFIKHHIFLLVIILIASCSEKNISKIDKVSSPDFEQKKQAVTSCEWPQIPYDKLPVVYFMSAIVHEFTHYKQWKATNDPRLKATFGQGFDYKEAGFTDEEICNFHWSREREAYWKSCDVMIKLGLFDELPEYEKLYCDKVYNDKAFDQALFWNQVKSQKGTPQEIC